MTRDTAAGTPAGRPSRWAAFWHETAETFKAGTTVDWAITVVLLAAVVAVAVVVSLHL